MASRTIFFAFLILLIFSSVGFSQDLDAFFKGMESGKIPQCMQKILPCQPFIKLPENPSPTCCLPLKEMLAGDLQCLCSFFNDSEMLKALNVTQSQALKLPKACGAADVDISACNNAGPPPTGSTDAPPPPPAKTSDDGSKANSSRRNNNPSKGIGYGFAAASSIVALLLSPLL